MLNLLIHFFRDGMLHALKGSKGYFAWLFGLLVVIALGGFAYRVQLSEGLKVTGMTDHVSWGLYISNFTFFVGIAAAAVMLILPAYIFNDMDFIKVALIGEGVAVSALIVCLLFVTVDLGSPERVWHLIPKLGYFNWPNSMLAWDVLVLNGYLALNTLIPFYILFNHYLGKEADKKKYFPFVLLSVFWAVAIHLVTAFLYAGLPARPFWNNALLGPRFLASAFAGGPAFILVILSIVDYNTGFKIQKRVVNKLALVVAIAAQINLVMLGSEIFKEFYHPTEHSNSATYLFFGLHGHNRLVPWIWTAIGMNILATIMLSIHRLRENHKVLMGLCIMLFTAIWIEKGMGLVVPGFIPSPLGEIVEYSPSLVEIAVTCGVLAIGMLFLTFLVKVAIGIELGTFKAKTKDLNTQV